MAENNPAEIPRTTLPRYAREAAELALQLATLSTEELERMLRTNRQIAATNRPALPASSTAKRPSLRCWPTRASYSGISPRSDSPPGISNTHSSTSTSRRSSTGCSGRWTQSAATGWKGTPYCRGTTTKRCSGTGRDG